MAISAPHYKLMQSLKPRLHQGGSLLEIGEANWYGEANPELLCEDGISKEEIRATGGNLFALAKLAYKALFAPKTIRSIDINGTVNAIRHDLNAPLFFDEPFDIVINHGTAEHVFNIAEVFNTMHNACEVGGLMIHEAPFTGWIEHGFFNLQPTLFYDLAAANCYEIVLIAIHEIVSGGIVRLESREHVLKLAERNFLPKNGNLFVCFCKRLYGDLRIPFQGYYAQSLSPQGKRAWEAMR